MINVGNKNARWNYSSNLCSKLIDLNVEKALFLDDSFEIGFVGESNGESVLTNEIDLIKNQLLFNDRPTKNGANGIQMLLKCSRQWFWRQMFGRNKTFLTAFEPFSETILTIS